MVAGNPWLARLEGVNLWALIYRPLPNFNALPHFNALVYQDASAITPSLDFQCANEVFQSRVQRPIQGPVDLYFNAIGLNLYTTFSILLFTIYE